MKERDKITLNEDKILSIYENMKIEMEENPNDRDVHKNLENLLIMEMPDERFRQPFIAMENTLYGKRDRYYDIARVWLESGADAEPWVLLALIDTIAEMDPSIYEHYRTLSDLFLSLLKKYLQKPFHKSSLAALAIFRACRLNVVQAGHYALEGEKRMEGEDISDLYYSAKCEQMEMKEKWEL